MLLNRIKLITIVCLVAFFLSGCSSGKSTIVFHSQKKEHKTQAESSVRVENGVIIYKDTKKYDTSIIDPKDDKKDYIFGN